MMQDEQIYTLALTRIYGLGLVGACNLIREMGSAGDIFRYRKELPERIPGVSEKLVKALLANNLNCSFCEIESSYGHDAFLLEVDRLGTLIKGFLANQREKFL